MPAIEDRGLDPGPPSSATRRTRSDNRWWVVGTFATIVLIGLQALTRPKWRAGLEFVSSGLTFTLIATAGGFCIAIVPGRSFAFARLSKNTGIKNVATHHIELIRGVPVLATILLMSIVAFDRGADMADIDPPSKVVLGTLPLGIIDTAFIAVAFRADIESIPVGQREAGESIGLSKRQVGTTVVRLRRSRTSCRRSTTTSSPS